MQQQKEQLNNILQRAGLLDILTKYTEPQRYQISDRLVEYNPLLKNIQM